MPHGNHIWLPRLISQNDLSSSCLFCVTSNPSSNSCSLSWAVYTMPGSENRPDLVESNVRHASAEWHQGIFFFLQGLQIEDARQSNSTQELHQAKTAAKKAKKQRQRASRQQAHQSHQLSKQAQPSQQSVSPQQTSFIDAAQPDDLAQAAHRSRDRGQQAILLSQTHLSQQTAEQSGIKISNDMQPRRSAHSAATLDEPFDVQPSPADVAASQQGQGSTLADQLPSQSHPAVECGKAAEQDLQQLAICSTPVPLQMQTGTGHVECSPDKQESDAAFLQQLVCCPITQVRAILSKVCSAHQHQRWLA